MNKKILFFKIGSFSSINHNVIKILQENFKEHEIIVVDVQELAFSPKKTRIINWFYFIKEYGIDFLMLHKSRWAYKDWLRVTSYMFKMIKREIINFAKDFDVLFTFQTGSTFDGSIEGVPHFVYTDSTVLANYYYPNINLKSVLKSKSFMQLEPEVYKNATINFLFSTNQVKSLKEQYHIDENKLKLVYAGPNAINKIELSSKKLYNNKTILFVGVNWERKGGITLAKAFNIVLKRHPDAKLIIVGVNKREVLHFSPDIDKENCEFVGKVPLEEVEKYFLKACVFCMPTKIEPFGVVFIESYMRKVPVVATNIGAIPDLVIDGKTGFLFHPNDINGIAEKLSYLLDNPNICEEFGLRGYDLISQVYTWEFTGKRIASSIRQILDV